MAFVTLSSSAIASGEPTTTDLWTTTKGNQDDHETRIVSLEGGSATPFFPIEFQVLGDYSVSSPRTEIDGIIRLPFALTFTGVRLIIHNAGTAGTTECDIEKDTGSGFSTILSTKPSVAFGAGDRAISTNAVLSVTTGAGGDFLRCNLTTTQTGSPDGFTVLVEFTKT